MRALTGGIALTATVVLLAAACSSSSSKAPASSSGATGTTGASLPGGPMLQSIGAGEGALNIIAWAGYAESGANDPKVNWVGPFEQQTGCKVNAKIGNTSDEMVQLMATGQYDGVSASGNATLRLIDAGQVSPVNVNLLTNYNDVSPFLKLQQYNSVGGTMYGQPHGWGANLLMWNPKVLTTAPDSWSVVWDPSSPYKGKVTAYDDPTNIADAAVYLMATQPSLGIKNPYALDQTQLNAATDLLKKQKAIVGEYWSDYLKASDAFEKGSLVVGSAWQLTANTVNSAQAGTVMTTLPKEGATAWSDTWMISAHAAHPNCMYKWMNYISSPPVQAQVAEYFGEAPANPKACADTQDKTFCDTYHATDASYAKQLWYWTTPTAKCLDGRTNVTCMDNQAWSKAWNDLRAS